MAPNSSADHFSKTLFHPSYHQPGNIQSLGIREFPVMLLVMMVAFFQVQYIVTSDAIIISNFTLKTDSILANLHEGPHHDTMLIVTNIIPMTKRTSTS